MGKKHTASNLPKPAPKPVITYCHIYKRIFFIFILIGAALRLFLIQSRYQNIIEQQNEVSTPVNSWNRILQAVHLEEHHHNPYDGDLFHETPLSLSLYKPLVMFNLSKLMFVLVDVCTAIIFYFIGQKYIKSCIIQQAREQPYYLDSTKEHCIQPKHLIYAPLFTMSAYLFHPFIILTCVGRSTIVFHNFFLALFLLALLNHKTLISITTLAICSTLTLYPILLIVPLCLSYIAIHKSCKSIIPILIIFISELVLLHILCSTLNHNTNYVNNVYKFILSVPDLRPDIGLFWYFFIEMFDHYSSLFLCSFQINATILHLIPLTIKFRKDPFFICFSLIYITAIFKSYPCLGDTGFAMCLIPCFVFLFPYMQQLFITGTIFFITIAMAPTVWYLWIYADAANANFYFGATLAFIVGNIIMLTDILFARVRREFILLYGDNVSSKGTLCRMILK